MAQAEAFNDMLQRFVAHGGPTSGVSLYLELKDHAKELGLAK
jgi:hypothetical protein